MMEDERRLKELKWKVDKITQIKSIVSKLKVLEKERNWQGKSLVYKNQNTHIIEEHRKTLITNLTKDLKETDNVIKTKET